jgi:ADP-heptose:LPS heptosyltransferase
MNLNLAKYLDRYLGILLCYLFAALALFREMVAPREGTIRVRTVLLAKLWGIGNLVMLLPILGMVRRRYPKARIHFLTLERNREVFLGRREIDRLWTIDDAGFLRFGGSLLRALVGLRREKVDVFVDFEQFARTTTLLGFLIGAPQRIGLRTPRQGRYLLYTAPVRYSDDQHMTRTFLDLARVAGVREEYVPVPLDTTMADVEGVTAMVPDTTGPLVVLHPGSGDNFVGRRWPAANFARLADVLVRRHGARPVFTGSAAERSLVRAVISQMQEVRSATDLSGRLSLRELAALLSRARLLVSNDTGPVHLASAAGVPVLGLYGPNTPVLYGPLSPGSRAFYRALPCSPCITNMNYKTSFCRLPICIRDIDVREVAEAADGILGGPA